MIDKSGLKLVSKENGEVSAYHDSSIFFAIKGCSVDKKQEGLPTEPYGIIPSHYENPFTLEFDEEDLTVSIKPGILHVYGRQVELTEAVEVYDFHSTVESQLMYCTIYIEIGLEDMTLQTARLKIDIAGAGYKNFDANMTRDNLYRLDHGVFQAPIARFQYAPSATPHFSNGEIVMPTLEGESREAVREINYNGKINDVPCSDLWEQENPATHQGRTGIFKQWSKASNEAALAIYKSIPGHNENTGGYSIAAQGEKFGDTETHETTAINSSLTGVLSVNRINLGKLGNMGGSSYSYSKKIRIDRSQIQYVRFYTTGSFKAKIKNSWTSSFFGLGGSSTQPENDNWIEAPDTEHQHGLSHWPYDIEQFHRFAGAEEWLTLPAVGGTLTLIYYYQNTLCWVDPDSGVYYDYWKFGYVKESNWGSISGTENKWNSNTMGSSTAKRKLAFIKFKVKSETELEIEITSNTESYYEGWEGLIYYWNTIHQLSDFKDNTLEGKIDIVYKGDVRL